MCREPADPSSTYRGHFYIHTATYIYTCHVNDNSINIFDKMEATYTSNINGMKSELILADRMDLVLGAILMYIKKEHRASQIRRR